MSQPVSSRLGDAEARPRRPAAKRTLLLVAWGVLLTAVLAAGALRSSTKEDGSPRQSHPGREGGHLVAQRMGPGLPAGTRAQIARGKYLVEVVGWNGGRMSNEDLRAVYAYLRSLPAIRDGVAAAQLPAAGKSH